MNRLETKIHSLLEDYPAAKDFTRDVYQRICSFIPIRNKIPDNLVTRCGYFYGFHNTCPWSSNSKLLLTHKVRNTSLRKPRAGESIGVGCFTGENFETYTPLAESQSWNWQQGSLAQWLGTSSHLIFNDFNGESNYARIVNSVGIDVSSLDMPIAAVSPDGRNALSYSFERLRTGMPGYEYASGSNAEEHVQIPRSDGLYLIDLDSGEATKIFSIEEIVTYLPETSFKGAYHFFSHCLFSPSNKRIAFYHRWRKPGKMLRTRLITCDLDGSERFIYPIGDTVSHYIWVDDSHILAYAGTKQAGCHYYYLSDKLNELSTIGERWFTSDGHPNISPDKRWVLTDTYPNRYRMQYILLYDLWAKTGYQVLRLRIPFKYRNELRCDFHPRWDRTGNTISFDSIHNGERAHCTLAIDFNKITS